MANQSPSKSGTGTLVRDLTDIRIEPHPDDQSKVRINVRVDQMDGTVKDNLPFDVRKDHLVEIAEEIRRQYNPTPEEQIIDSLGRIEDLLDKNYPPQDANGE